jgi:hypothetical protein
MSNSEIPKDDRLLLVLDTSMDLWDLVMDALVANATVEFVIVTDAFLQLLDPKQTRELLSGIGGLSHLRMVQIDFPLDDNTNATTTTTTTTTSNQYHEKQGHDHDDDTSMSTILSQNSRIILDAVVWMIRRAKGLTALRLNNLEMVKTSKDFAKACKSHPSLKDVQVVGGEEGVRGSYRSQSQNWKEQDDEQPLQNSSESDVAQAMVAQVRQRIRYKEKRERRASGIALAPVNTTPDYESIKRRLRKAVSKNRKSPSPEPERNTSHHRRQIRRTRSVSPHKRKHHHRHHKHLDRKISRSYSPIRRDRRHHEDKRQSRHATIPEDDRNEETRSCHRSNEHDDEERSRNHHDHDERGNTERSAEPKLASNQDNQDETLKPSSQHQSPIAEKDPLIGNVQSRGRERLQDRERELPNSVASQLRQRRLSVSPLRERVGLPRRRQTLSPALARRVSKAFEIHSIPHMDVKF